MLTDSLKNKVALVTGAGRGIGKEIAKTLASCGAFVIVNYNSSPDAAEQTVKEIIKQGGMAAPVQCDVSDFDACGKMMEMIINNYGHLDILVNNAGASERSRSKYLYHQSPDVISEMLELNLKAAMLCTRKAFQFMVKKDGSPESGKVINIASVVGVQGRIRLSSYAAAKSGLIGFTKSVALEMGHHHITVNCVSPGIIVRGTVTGKNKDAIEKTNCMHVVPPTESISSAVAFLASSEADMITGQNLIVDAGRSLGLIGD